MASGRPDFVTAAAPQCADGLCNTCPLAQRQQRVMQGAFISAQGGVQAEPERRGAAEEAAHDLVVDGQKPRALAVEEFAGGHPADAVLVGEQVPGGVGGRSG